MCPTLCHDIPMIPHEYHIEFQKLNPNHHFLVKTPSSPTMYAETVGMGWMLAPVAAPELRTMEVVLIPAAQKGIPTRNVATSHPTGLKRHR